MSFFQQEGDDSNLQYDDAAFLYFIASALSLAAIGLFIPILSSLRTLISGHEAQLQKQPIFKEKINKLNAKKRSDTLNSLFYLKVLALVIVCVLFIMVYDQSKKAENKLKGFDPYQILGLQQDASLRDIKKAYRKLALEFHPDKNAGNVEAQNRFILISKSYQCFTNEEKKANCFKFGNPDGANTFRVGIGLPHFFIKAEYQYYVLPIVLAVILIWIPWMMIRWNNRTQALDFNGISINTYSTLFKSLSPRVDKYTFVYILASFPELYQLGDFGPISPQNKEKLFELAKSNPLIDRPVLYELNDNQLLIVWEVYRYAANISDYTVPRLREQVEEYLAKTIQIVKMFSNKEINGASIYGNPEWTVQYLGYGIVGPYIEFQKDYNARTLMITSNEKWLWNLSLDDPQRQKIQQSFQSKGANIYTPLQLLTSEQKLKTFCSYVPEGKRSRIESQLKSWPIYEIQLKLKLEGQEVNEITNANYAYIYYKIRQVNKTRGYSYINNYPFPKKDKLYILGLDGNDVVLGKEVVLEDNKEFVQRVLYKSAAFGQHTLRVFIAHESCRNIDVGAVLNFKVTEAPPEDLEKPVEFHPDDINLERLYKNFFEELLDMSMDPEQNELSDSEGEGQDQKEQDNNGEGQHEEHSESSSSNENIGEQND